MTEEVPVERFLGRVEASHGPFGLLGLRPADYDPEVIKEALRARLTQLSRHRQAGSTEADEVRLALHVAAAQLSDPEVRRHILRRQGIGVREEGIGHAPEKRERAPRRTPGVRGAAQRGGVADDEELIEGFKHVALRVLAHSGGWNEFAKRRLGGLAHAYGLDMGQLRRTLTLVAQERRGLGGAAPMTRRPGWERGEARAGGRSLAARPSAAWRRTIAVSTTVLLLLTAGMGLVLIGYAVSGDAEPPSATVTVTTPEGEGAGVADREREAVQASTALEISRGATPSEGSAGELLEEIRGAAAALGERPVGSAQIFARVLERVGGRWPEIDSATLQALRVELANFQLAAIRADREAAIIVAEAIAGPASRVNEGEGVFDRMGIARASFSAGLMARLSRDNLISLIGSRFRGVLVRLSYDGTGVRERDFWPGVGLGMEAIGRRYIATSGDRERRGTLGRGWSAWIEVLERLRVEAPEVGERVLLDTIERALIEGPDPAMSQAAHDAISRLVAELDFVSSEGAASERLVRWFDDSRVPTSALSLVTSRVVFSSLIPGFGPEMMLRPDASEGVRASLRDDYALKLGLPVSTEDRKVVDLWRARVREVLESRIESVDSVRALERAGVLAMLNEAAAQRWAGGDEEAYDTARSAWLDPMMDQAVPLVDAEEWSGEEIERMTDASRRPDGAWARRYLEAMRNAGIRQELLNELSHGEGPRGPADADVLAEAACYGGPIPLRRSAQSVVERFSDDPYVINGLLEAMPNAARSPDVSEMVEEVTERSLPSTRDPSWRAAARRALLERLVEMIGRRELTRIEALQLAIRGSYEDRVVASGAASALASGGGEGGSSLSRADVTQLARALRASTLEHARRFSEGQWTFTPLHELERKHRAREGLARGALQEFAAEQLGLTEVMAYVVAAERTSQASEVGEVLEGLSSRRRGAAHVFHQIEAAEEAMLRLWLIRLGEEGGL